MEPIYRVVGSRAKCRLTPTYDQAWGLKYSKVLARRARRRAALVTRIGRMKVKLKACHTLGRAHLQFTRWLIKPTSEARNTGAATPVQYNVPLPQGCRTSDMSDVWKTISPVLTLSHKRRAALPEARQTACCGEGEVFTRQDYESSSLVRV